MTDLIVIDESKVELIKRTVAKDATNDELDLFLHQARRMGLDPLARQIHFQKFVTKAGPRVSFITTIDGYRLIADRTGKYAGSGEPMFEGQIIDPDYGAGKGPNIPAKATVTVHKIVGGAVRPFSNSAYWQEYYPGFNRGHMWRKMPHVMLAKVAEAGALRKAFPADLSGAYTADEMSQADVEIIEPEPPVDIEREKQRLEEVIDIEIDREVLRTNDDEPAPEVKPVTKKTNGNGNGGPRVTASMLRELHALGTFIYGKGWDAERARQSKAFGKESSKDWSIDEYYGVVNPLKEMKEKQLEAGK
jgi:phage recombination protein Bet